MTAPALCGDDGREGRRGWRSEKQTRVFLASSCLPDGWGRLCLFQRLLRACCLDDIPCLPSQSPFFWRARDLAAIFISAQPEMASSYSQDDDRRCPPILAAAQIRQPDGCSQCRQMGGSATIPRCGTLKKTTLGNCSVPSAMGEPPSHGKVLPRMRDQGVRLTLPACMHRRVPEGDQSYLRACRACSVG